MIMKQKRIYIAYRFVEHEKKKLRKNLEQLSKCFESLGYKTFIFYRDIENWKEPILTKKQIILRALKELKKSDIFVLFNDAKDKGEGCILEAGFAKAFGKEMVLLDLNGINYYFIDELIDFKVSARTMPNLLKDIKAKFPLA